MINFTDYSKMINKIIVNEGLINDVISVYSYGSIAQGNFEHNYSDADLWFVIKYNSISDRIKITKKIEKIFSRELVKLLDITHNVDGEKKYSYHSNYYFSEEEFNLYIKLYPTRVLYPLKKNVWKLAYGKNHFSHLTLPVKAEIIENLQYDYELFANDFHWFAFTKDPREMVKYFLRAMKKAIWILKDEYLSCKDEVLEKISNIFNSDKLLCDVINLLKNLKENDYFLIGEEYLNLYLDMSNIIEMYGKKINQYIKDNNFNLLDKEKLNSISTWGNYVWEFAASVNEYLKVCDTDTDKIASILIYNYSHFMKCFDYKIINSLLPQEILLPKYKTPPLKSRIIDYKVINKMTYDNIVKLDGYHFLIGEHRKNVLLNNFKLMTYNELINYTENKYFPAIYEVYYYLLMDNSLNKIESNSDKYNTIVADSIGQYLDEVIKINESNKN